MNINEKLQHFYDTIITDTEKEAVEALEQHKRKLTQTLDEHKSIKLQEAESAVKCETEMAQREINRALSAEHLSLKRSWRAKQNALKETLFTQVKQKLADFMNTPAYEDYLCKKVLEAKEFAGAEEIFIYLSSTDASRQEVIASRTGLPVLVSDKAFLGGIQAAIPSRNLLINHSFQDSLAALWENFSFEGGQRNA
ncbi:MAG: V-type ATP synthase subunit E [Eubacteriales bacterium]|nr:V-type ATP synthase subunit E [Eubacteriales bacterium]